MADVHIVRDGDVLHYDPSVDGYPSTVWSTVSGSPSVNNNDVLVINSAEIVGISGVTLSELTLDLNIPSDPSGGDTRSWGFQSPQDGNEARIEFVIDGDTFKVLGYDEGGNNLFDKKAIWDSAWSGSFNKYKVKVNQGGVYFTVDGNVVAKFTDVNMPETTLVPHINNDNSDDLKLEVMSIT